MDVSTSPPPLIPDQTPFTDSSSTFPTPATIDTDLVEAALTIPSPSHDEQEHDDGVTSPYRSETLTSADIKSDPILSSLAKQQGHLTTPTSKHGAGFKAKPAPASTRAEGLGPRMTKAAALRQGLDWEASKAARSPGVAATTGAEAATVTATGFVNTPGHKRQGLDLGKNITSLATPTIAPRPTRASQLRAGQGVTPSPVKRDFEAIAKANKARMAEETAMRRRSIALPASLSAPTIAPRANKTSLLRTGTALKSPLTSTPDRQQTALKATTATNVDVDLSKDKESAADKDKEAKLARRASVAGVKSLGAPSIAPRMNRTAMLRAPPSTSAGSSTPAPPASSAPSVPSVLSPRRDRPPHPLSATSTKSTPSALSTGDKSASASASASSRPTATLGSPAPTPGSGSGSGPRPTKASLLRAGLGAKAKVKV